MKKNEIYEITITDIDQDGNGIGHVETESGNGNRRMAVFVKDTVPGDMAKVRIVKINKTLCFGRLEDIVIPSPDRVQPRCSKARACGGCMLQHIDYSAQLSIKQKKVINCLSRIGGVQDVEAKMEPITGMEEPWHFRNKMQFPVGMDATGSPVLGFYAGRTHTLIPLEDCPVGHPINRIILRVVRTWMQRYEIPIYDETTHNGLLRHVLTRAGYATGELMVCLVINGRRIPHAEALWDALTSSIQKETEDIRLTSLMVNCNTEKTNRILGDRSFALQGESSISDRIGDLTFQISPQSFYQVNPVQTRNIYEKALAYAGLTGQETVWDMYCGTGTISLFLAKQAGKVFGVEIVPDAIRDARENARMNGIENTEFYTGKAEDVVPRWFAEQKANHRNERVDVVVVDPPRKGCDERLLQTIVQMRPNRLVYVSCDPATLARDVRYLEGEGFSLQKAAVFDAFCHSMHCETVALLGWKKGLNSQVQFKFAGGRP